MKSLLAGTALLVALASPAIAQASTVSATSSPSSQSVYSTVSTTEIVNSDGSVTEIHVVTRYYVFGYE
jgi:hypothetical protein